MTQLSEGSQAVGAEGRGAVAPLSVSLIIPTKHRPGELVETVRSIVKQTSPPQELIIVDQSPESAEVQVRPLVEGCGGMQLIYLWEPELPGLVAARIRSLDVASGDIVFFVDDDITLAPDCISRLMERYGAQPELAGVCAVDTGCAELPWWQVLGRRLFTMGPFWDERSVMGKRYQALSQPRLVRWFSGGWMSYRRWVFDKFQFEDALWGHRWNGSIDFSYRVSSRHPLVIDPAVQIVHRLPYGTYSPEEFVRVRVAGTFFFFARNVKRNLWGWVCFLWIMFGIFLRSVWLGVETRGVGHTTRVYVEEFRKGLRFLRQPFTAPY